MPTNAHTIGSVDSIILSENTAKHISPIITNDYRNDNQRFIDLLQASINYNIPRQIACKTNMKPLHRIIVAGVIPDNGPLNYKIYPSYLEQLYQLVFNVATLDNQTILMVHGNINYCYLHYNDSSNNNFEYAGAVYGEWSDLHHIPVTIATAADTPFTIEIAILNL